MRPASRTHGLTLNLEGLEVGDIVLSINGKAIASIEQFQVYVEESLGQKSQVVVERVVDGSVSQKEVLIVPRVDPPEEEGALGVVITSTEIYFPPFWQRPFYGAYYGFQEAVFWGFTVIVSLGSMVVNLFKGLVPKDVAGPVGRNKEIRGVFATVPSGAQGGARQVHGSEYGNCQLWTGASPKNMTMKTKYLHRNMWAWLKNSEASSKCSFLAFARPR